MFINPENPNPPTFDTVALGANTVSTKEVTLQAQLPHHQIYSSMITREQNYGQILSLKMTLKYYSSAEQLALAIHFPRKERKENQQNGPSIIKLFLRGQIG